MRCTKAREFISLDLDGQLPPDRAAGLTRHLDLCGECRGYREDLAVGHRLLAATEPELSENFEWRLQLRLNQTLAQAAAQAIHPWQDQRAGRGTWWRNFGAAAAVGMAAVLAVAMLVGPRQAQQPGGAGGTLPTALVGTAAGGGDRLDLDPRGGWIGLGTGSGQRPVSTQGAAPLLGGRPAWLDRNWSYRSVDDLRDQTRLQQENRQLRSQVFQMQRQLRSLQSQLDTARTPALDLPVGQ
ncbi:MAG: zf-HC2 domain-containing protein [Candidatus Krumholzibacteriia bacterium]